MKNQNRTIFWILLLVGFISLAACSSITRQTTPESSEVIPSPTLKLTATSMPSPTPDRFSAKALAFVPKTIEEIALSVEVKSPITDLEGYEDDVTKVLGVIHAEILQNYSGKMMKAGGGQIRVGLSDPIVDFTDGANLTPIASIHFEWKEYNVPILFFPAEDNQGRFVIGIIFSPTQDYKSDGNYARRKNNPAPDWNLSAFLKMFPLQLIGDGIIDTMTTSSFYEGDEFMTAFSDVVINDCEENDLRSAYWNMLGEDGIFNRECELQPLVMAGGQ